MPRRCAEIIALQAINAELPKHERVGRLYLTRDDWTTENKLLTPTMKLKRRTIEDHYRGLVDDGDQGGIVIRE